MKFFALQWVWAAPALAISHGKLRPARENLEKNKMVPVPARESLTTPAPPTPIPFNNDPFNPSNLVDNSLPTQEDYQAEVERNFEKFKLIKI